MRDLIVTENISVDGVIDLSGGWFDPQAQGEADRSDLLAEMTAQGQASDAFLTGRVTFEQMRSYWPHQTDDPTGISDYLNKVPKYVVSGSLGDPGWEPTTVLRGPLREEIAALKAAPGKDIVVTGSITLVHALIAAGLVDEYRLFVYPLVAGSGARLFGGDARGGGLAGLELAEARPFRSGVVLLRYRAPSPASTG
jgi:dihydrofolate reductase